MPLAVGDVGAGRGDVLAGSTWWGGARSGGTAGSAGATGRALGGDPWAIRESASCWMAAAARYEDLAEDLRRCRIAGFEGDEARRFETIVDARARDLDATGRAWRAGGRALSRYAERLADCQRRLGSLADQVRDARSEWAAAGASPGGVGGALLEPLVARVESSERRPVAGADRVLEEHRVAVRRCRAELDTARALLPTVRPAIRAAPTSPPAVAVWSAPARGGLGLRASAASLKTMSGQSAYLAPAATPHLTGWDDFFSELGSLFGAVGMAFAVLGPGGGGGAGLVLAGGAGPSRRRRRSRWEAPWSQVRQRPASG